MAERLGWILGNGDLSVVPDWPGTARGEVVLDSFLTIPYHAPDAARQITDFLAGSQVDAVTIRLNFPDPGEKIRTALRTGLCAYHVKFT